MDEQKLINTGGHLICGVCCYDANPFGATHCHKCGMPLVVNTSPSTKSPVKYRAEGFRTILILTLLLFGGVGFWMMWRQNQTVETTNSTSRSSSDIRYYTTMKEVPNVPKGAFNYGGALPFAAITAQGTNEAMNQAHPQFRLRYTEPKQGSPGSIKGIDMLLNNEISFAQAAGPVTESQYYKANQLGITLEQVPVAIDVIVAFTNLGVSISGLSFDQLQAIYKGELTNWKQVGGPDLPITPVTMNPQVNQLPHILLGADVSKISDQVTFVRDYTGAIRKVTETPGAIAFGAAGPVLGQQSIRPVPLAAHNSTNYVQPFTYDSQGKQHLNTEVFWNNEYPFTRRLFIVIRRDNTINEQVGVAYTNMLLSTEGQKFVERAGFVPLRGVK